MNFKNMYSSEQKKIYKKCKLSYSEPEKVWKLYYNGQEVADGQNTKYALLQFKKKQLILTGFYVKDKFEIKLKI